MAQFLGYLLKCGNNTDNSFIEMSTYDSAPNQREEIKAVRDENTRDLLRVTADGMKTALKFTTIPMNLANKIKMQNFFKAGMIDTKQRKCKITFWNDEDNEYQTKYFYIPNFHYSIDSISSNDIQYNELDIELIEY